MRTRLVSLAAVATVVVLLMMTTSGVPNVSGESIASTDRCVVQPAEWALDVSGSGGYGNDCEYDHRCGPTTCRHGHSEGSYSKTAPKSWTKLRIEGPLVASVGAPVTLKLTLRARRQFRALRVVVLNTRPFKAEDSGNELIRQALHVKKFVDLAKNAQRTFSVTLAPECLRYRRSVSKAACTKIRAADLVTPAVGQVGVYIYDPTARYPPKHLYAGEPRFVGQGSYTIAIDGAERAPAT